MTHATFWRARSLTGKDNGFKLRHSGFDSRRAYQEAKWGEDMGEHYHDMKTYFIQADNGLIKIGRSVDPKARIASMRTSSPAALKLLGFLNRDIEGELHKRFSDLRQHGEWFRPLKELRDYIENRFSGVRVLDKKASMTVPDRKMPRFEDYGTIMEQKLDCKFLHWRHVDNDESDIGSAKYYLRLWIETFFTEDGPIDHDDKDELYTVYASVLGSFLCRIDEIRPDAILLPTNDRGWMGIVYHPFSVIGEIAMIQESTNQAFYLLDVIGPTLNVFYLNRNGTWESRLASGLYDEKVHRKGENKHERTDTGTEGDEQRDVEAHQQGTGSPGGCDAEVDAAHDRARPEQAGLS